MTEPFYQAPPSLENQFVADRVLQSHLRRMLPPEILAAITPQLLEMGALAAGPLRALAHRHRRDEPLHTPYDAWGQRIDRVQVPASWEIFARTAVEHGLIATAYERRHGAYSRLHQFSLVYLFDRSTQMYTCPLAMTDGCARTLETLAPAPLRHAVLPHLISRDPAQAWTSGQWMTERTGGSDVGLTQTVARCSPDGASWTLHGDKWFTSAVSSQVALTLARPEGNGPGGKGLALFLVELRNAQGALRNITVRRLKEKLGTRQLPTAELQLHGTPATPLAGLTDGVRHMGGMLNITRTWNAVCAVSNMRRGLALARDYAHKRHAFGTPLADKPLHLETLGNLAAEQAASFGLVFYAVQLLGREEARSISDNERAVLRLLQPLAKLLTGRSAVAFASEVLESFGGAGYVEDTGLPELLRDAQVLAIWEGTTNVLALEAFRIIRRQAALLPFVAAIQERTQAVEHADLKAPAEVALNAAQHAAQWWATQLDQAPQVHEAGARACALTLARAMALALLVEHAQWLLQNETSSWGVEAARRYAAMGIDQLRGFAWPHAPTIGLALGN